MKKVLLAVLTMVAVIGLSGVQAPDSAHAANLTTVTGDADCDEQLTPNDALTVALDVAEVSSSFCVQIGNLLCEDELNMEDAMAILRFLAHLPIEQGGRCFIPGIAIPDEVESSGTATIHGTFLFDFDVGAETETGADIQWENDGTSPPDIDMFLTPITPAARVLLLPAVPAYPVLNTVYLGAIPYEEERIDGPGGVSPGVIETGTVFGVVTDLGNFAKVKVLQVGYELEIEWVTYSE